MLKFIVPLLLSTMSYAKEFKPKLQYVDTVAGRKPLGYLGWKSEAARLKAPYRTVEMNESWMPKKFSWKGSGVLPPTRDQGSCGSCWAMGITRAFEIAVNIQGYRETPNLSEQQMVSCDKTAYGCSGGFAESAQYVVDFGLTEEKNFPYAARDLACKSNLPIAEKAISYHLLGSANKKPTFSEIKAAILRYGSAYVTVSAGGNGWSGSSDTVTGCKNRGTNHIVLAIGYDEKNLIISNSWGSAWGDGGYAKIPFGCDEVGDEAGYIVVE